MNVPQAAPWLAKLDDWVGHGKINPVKKWWWDLEEQDDGGYSADGTVVNERELQTDLDLQYEDQTLVVYPAPLAPPPYTLFRFQWTGKLPLRLIKRWLPPRPTS